MKKFTYLLLGLLVIGFTSCSKKDEVPQGIFGKWIPTEFTMQGDVSQSGFSGQATGECQFTEGNEIVFNEDNTVTGTYVPSELTIHFQVMGQTFTQTQTINESMFPENGKWTKDGDVLTLEDDEGNRTHFNIETMTSSSLVLTADQSSFPDQQGMGEEIKNFKGKLTLKR